MAMARTDFPQVVTQQQLQVRYAAYPDVPRLSAADPEHLREVRMLSVLF